VDARFSREDTFEKRHSRIRFLKIVERSRAIVASLPAARVGIAPHSLRAVTDVPNVYVDLSGSGVDGGMLEACIESAGMNRLLWGSDITMDTGWAKLRYLETFLSKDDMALVRWKNAARIFPPGAFPTD